MSHSSYLDITSSYIPIELYLDLRIDLAPPVINTHLMQTQEKCSIHKPKQLFLASTSSVILQKPSYYEEAKGISKWEEAMQKEFQTLLNNKTWILFPLPLDKKALG